MTYSILQIIWPTCVID